MSAGMDWQDHGALSQIGPGECHVWRLRFEPGAEGKQQVRSALSEEERARADRMRSAEGRAAFCACRAALRLLLARFGECAPGELLFRDGPFGKPQMQPGGPGDWLQFNVSHSGSVGLIAVTAAARVGVDVERIRSDLHVDDLARDFFTPAERDTLGGLAGEQRVAAFYRAWTRKEARIKARGESIARPPKDDGSEGWHLQDLPAGEGYAAALCVEGLPESVHLWNQEL